MKRVLLEKGVWLASGRGDPPRTLIEENARGFASNSMAKKALEKAREYRPFPNAQIETYKGPLRAYQVVVDGFSPSIVPAESAVAAKARVFMALDEAGYNKKEAMGRIRGAKLAPEFDLLIAHRPSFCYSMDNALHLKRQLTPIPCPKDGSMESLQAMLQEWRDLYDLEAGSAAIMGQMNLNWRVNSKVDQFSWAVEGNRIRVEVPLQMRNGSMVDISNFQALTSLVRMAQEKGMGATSGQWDFPLPQDMASPHVKAAIALMDPKNLLQDLRLSDAVVVGQTGLPKDLVEAARRPSGPENNMEMGPQ
jgi:hypothetical protein